MSHQALDNLETVGTKKHDGKIAGDSIKTRQVRRQRAHIQAFEPQPRELCALDSPRTLNLTLTVINRQNLSDGPHLLCQVESRNPVARSDVENGGPRVKVQLLQQRLSKRGGPIVICRERQTRPNISPVFGHAAAP